MKDYIMANKYERQAEKVAANWFMKQVWWVKLIVVIVIIAVVIGAYFLFVKKPVVTASPAPTNSTVMPPTNPSTDQSNNPNSSTSEGTGQGNEALLAQLVELTNNANPGATKDYYWDNGSADINATACAGSVFPTSGQVAFQSDSQGRSGTACADLTYEMYVASQGSRQGDPLDPPSWPSQYNKTEVVIGPYALSGKTYHGYMFNRSHSIADSLAGSQSYTSKYNFTTGTRTQNVGADQNGGMRAAEELAENYWKKNPNSIATIQYETTPLYQGNETIPRGSIVDIMSSDGSINKEIIVINDAEGWNLDYNTGDFTAR